MTLRLFLLQPDTAWTGRVDQQTFTYPLLGVTYDAGSTTITPEAGMTVLFGTSAGADDLGRTRLRDAAGIGSFGLLKIGWSSRGTRDGELKLEDNAYITILNDFRVWAKIPYIDVDTSTSPATSTTYKDGNLSVDDLTGADTPPKANTGAGFAATIDSGTSVITASWDASTKSKAYADGETISSYLWDVDDGTITVGSTSTAAITATFPAGFRWVKCTVTDSNSQIHSMRMPVYARDPASDTTISDFNIDNHQITQQGQRISLRIRESIPESTYPDGTLVMIWEDEPASASDRSHMVFIGWHHNDPATISTQRTGILQDTVFECLDVAGKLDTLPGFIQVIYGDATPATWEEMVAPNMDKYLHYLLHWHSTALDLADWTDSGTGSSFPFVVLGSDGESLWDQVARRAKALVPDYVLTCNTLGQMATIVDPMLQDTGDRTGTSQTTLGEDDWTSINYVHRRPPRVHWLRGDAILASSSTIAALFCVAPGSAPGQGEIESTSGEQLAKSQSDLNACEGHRYARLNAPEGLFRVTLAGGSDLDLEPANMTWVQLNISASSSSQRGFITSNRFLMQEINISYEHTRTGLARTVELLLEKEVDGVPAETYVQPVDDIPDPEYDPPPPPTYDDNPGETPGNGFGTAYAMLSSKLARTRDLSVASPVWADMTGSVTGTWQDWILDPWNVTTRGFALTTTGVWRATGLDGAGAPTWTQVLSSSDVATGTSKTFLEFHNKIQCSINSEDYVVCFATAQVDIGGGALDRYLYCCYSTDAGDSWSFALVIASPWQFPSDGYTHLDGGFDIVPHTIGGSLMLYAALYMLSSGGKCRIYRSADAGATWSLRGSVAISAATIGPFCLNTPYHNNEDGLTVWHSWPAPDPPFAPPASRIFKSTNGCTSSTAIDLPGTPTYYEETPSKRLGIEIYIQNSNQVAIWNIQNQFFKSIDGSTFTEVSYTGYVPGTHGGVSGAGGFPSNGSQYYILTTSRYVFVSIDGGITWINKTGNLQSIITSNESPGADIRRGVIVPVWVAE